MIHTAFDILSSGMSYHALDLALLDSPHPHYLNLPAVDGRNIENYFYKLD